MGNEQQKAKKRCNSVSSQSNVSLGKDQDSIFQKFVRASQRRKRGLNASFRGADPTIAFLDALFLPAYPIKTDIHNTDFEVLELVANGAFGSVLKVKCLQDEGVYAMKVMKKAKVLVDKAVQQCKDEALIQNEVGDHACIVKPHWIFQNKDDVFIVMDYIPQGELFTLWKKYKTFTETTIRIYIAELAMVIEYLHDSGVIYRDLKMENVLIDAFGHLKVIDFGLAKWLPRGQRTRTICGTLHYIAPEVLSGRPYGHSSDWWSVGILMYALLTGAFPVRHAKSHRVMADRVASSVYDLPFDRPFSWQARKCCKGLLEKDPNSRVHSLSSLSNEAFYHDFDFHSLLTNQSSQPIYLERGEAGSTARPRYQSSLIDMFLQDTLLHRGDEGSGRGERRDTRRRSRSVDAFLDASPEPVERSLYSLDSQIDESYLDNAMSRSVDCVLDERSRVSDDRANQSALAILNPHHHQKRRRRKARHSSERAHSHHKVTTAEEPAKSQNEASSGPLTSPSRVADVRPPGALSRSVNSRLDHTQRRTQTTEERVNQSAHAILQRPVTQSSRRRHRHASDNGLLDSTPRRLTHGHKPRHASDSTHSLHHHTQDDVFKFAWNDSVASQDGLFV